MALSRFWYAILGVAIAVSLYFGYLAVGQINRREAVAVLGEVASSSQTVEWALKIDSRRRLDALLGSSIDPVVQQNLSSAGGRDKIPQKMRDDTAKALRTANDKLPAEYKADDLFAVDREGRIIGYVSLDEFSIQPDEFELGGYAAVNDAIHGYLRDDAWVLGDRLYLVVTRPVEFDATQRPAGAVVGLKRVSAQFVADVARRTRSNVAFYAAGVKSVAAVGVDGFLPANFEGLEAEVKKLSEDKGYMTGSRSEPRAFPNAGVVGIFARLPGDAWLQGGGFAVVGAQSRVEGLMAVANAADDKDKASVPWVNLGGLAGLAIVLGLLFTVLEHTVPLRELVIQSRRLKSASVDGLQVPRFRGAYREVAQNINAGLERVAERGGGTTRKPADLESILGPVPAQPAMSAFSFPMQDAPSSGSALGPSSGPSLGVPPASNPASMAFSPPVAVTPPLGNKPPPPKPAAPPLAGPPMGISPAKPVAPVAAPLPPAPAARPAPPPPMNDPDEDEDATTIGAVPAELLAQATGELRAMTAGNEQVEWQAVYDDFVRVKKQCGESVEGLTFEKFQSTLRKNRDALVQRHGCNRVKFTVYVKEGRASLKATPVRE